MINDYKLPAKEREFIDFFAVYVDRGLVVLVCWKEWFYYTLFISKIYLPMQLILI